MADLSQLIEGYRRFREQDWAHERERWSELAEGQSPRVMILSCADSRVDPAQIFDARPGEMFVVRNIAALAPPYETTRGYHGVSAALEFAVTQLNVGEILVMGHGLCGGCAAALTGQFDDTEPGEGHFIADWVGMLSGASAAEAGAIPGVMAKAKTSLLMRVRFRVMFFPEPASLLVRRRHEYLIDVTKGASGSGPAA